MALPLAMLRGLQMLTTTKIGLAGVFSLASFIIAFDILRTVESLLASNIVGFNALWTNLECSIAVLVSALPSFVTLISSKKDRYHGRRGSPDRPRSLAISDSARPYLNDSSSGKLVQSGREPDIVSSGRTSCTTKSSTEIVSNDTSPYKETSVIV